MEVSKSGVARTLGVCILGVLLAVVAVSLSQTRGFAQAADDFVGPGESIQKAINAADRGDTIIVRGVHREDVIITKNGIKLRGDDALIEAPARAGSPCSKFGGGLTAICVLGDFNPETGEITGPRVRDVSVSGFTFRGFEDKDAFVIDFYAARNATVVGNRITGNAAKGIGLGGSVNSTIANNHVIGGPQTDAEGIFVNDSRNTKIVNNVVRNYVFGIIVERMTNTTIAGNDSIGNSVTGIGVIEGPDTKILSNDVTRNEVVGVYVEDFLGGQKSENLKAVANDISGSAFGVYIGDTKGGSFAGNQVHDNCAGMYFESYDDDGLRLVGGFEVKGNTLKNNTRSCRAARFGFNFSGIGIALLGARNMEVSANHLSGNVRSGPTRISGGAVVAVNPYFGETIKPRNNTVTANHFGRNKPDIFYDKSGSGNRFVGNHCNSSVPSRLCN